MEASRRSRVVAAPKRMCEASGGVFANGGTSSNRGSMQCVKLDALLSLGSIMSNSPNRGSSILVIEAR